MCINLEVLLSTMENILKFKISSNRGTEKAAERTFRFKLFI